MNIIMGSAIFLYETIRGTRFRSYNKKARTSRAFLFNSNKRKLFLLTASRALTCALCQHLFTNTNTVRCYFYQLIIIDKL